MASRGASEAFAICWLIAVLPLAADGTSPVSVPPLFGPIDSAAAPPGVVAGPGDAPLLPSGFPTGRSAAVVLHEDVLLEIARQPGLVTLNLFPDLRFVAELHHYRIGALDKWRTRADADPLVAIDRPDPDSLLAYRIRVTDRAGGRWYRACPARDRPGVFTIDELKAWPGVCRIPEVSDPHVFWACADPEPAPQGTTAWQSTARWRATWTRLGSPNYQATVWGAPNQSGVPVRIRVRDGRIVSWAWTRPIAPFPERFAQEYARRGIPLPPSEPRCPETWIFTVERLFQRIERAAARGADRIHVEWHPVLGYPTRVTVDWDSAAIDDEGTILLEDLVLE